MDGLKVEKSNGKGKYGKTYYYIRPEQDCSNRSRRIGGFTYAEIEEKKQKLIDRWFSPIVIYYKIEGLVIGSNSKKNALEEYWRICDVRDIGKNFIVELYQMVL